MPRKPDYKLAVMSKATGRKNPNAGGAWKNPDGSISLSINVGCVLTSDPDLAIILFPDSPTEVPLTTPAGRAKAKPVARQRSTYNDTDDEIPF